MITWCAVNGSQLPPRSRSTDDFDRGGFVLHLHFVLALRSSHRGAVGSFCAPMSSRGERKRPEGSRDPARLCFPRSPITRCAGTRAASLDDNGRQPSMQLSPRPALTSVSRSVASFCRFTHRALGGFVLSKSI